MKPHPTFKFVIKISAIYFELLTNIWLFAIMYVKILRQIAERIVQMSIIAIDQGTTSSRAILFDEKFNIVSQASHPITQIYPEAGYVEHDPEEIFKSVLRSVADCLYAKDEIPEAVGITNQRETVVVWERKTGRPIYNAIVWQCRRSADICEKLKKDGHAEYIKRTTGLPIDAYFSASKIKWILENVDGAREKCERGELCAGTVDSWLIYKLTGNHKTDITNASRTMLFDIISGTWDKKLCEIFSIPVEMLPEVHESAHNFGRIKKDRDIPAVLWGLSILSAIGDQQSALFGQRCLLPGDVKNTYGTGCFTLMNIGEQPTFDENLITTPAWRIDGKTTYALEGSVFNAGSSVQWLRDELGIISRSEECSLLAEEADSTKGAVFVSAFTGLGAPHWDMYARGGFVGITRGCGKKELCRAVLEGIAFQVYELVKTMEEASGCKISSLKVDGGASASNFLLAFEADLLGIPVMRPDNIETTALGAALMASLALGKLSLDENNCSIGKHFEFVPKSTRAEAEEKIALWKKAVAAVREFE